MTTGWPPGLLQDDSRELSKWFAGRLGARYEVETRPMNKFTLRPLQPYVPPAIPTWEDDQVCLPVPVKVMEDGHLYYQFNNAFEISSLEYLSDLTVTFHNRTSKTIKMRYPERIYHGIVVDKDIKIRLAYRLKEPCPENTSTTASAPPTDPSVVFPTSSSAVSSLSLDRARGDDTTVISRFLNRLLRR